MKQNGFNKDYYFGGVYKNYDTFLNYQKLARDLIKQYSFDSFLDIGCGCGNLVKEIKKQLAKLSKKPCDVQGIDISDFAVKKAGVSFVNLADCRKLPFADLRFDLVYILGTLAYLKSAKEVLKAMKEIYRVSRRHAIFEDVYNVPDKSSDDYDPYRTLFLTGAQWRKLWFKVLKKGDKIEFNKEEIVITKNSSRGYAT